MAADRGIGKCCEVFGAAVMCMDGNQKQVEPGSFGTVGLLSKSHVVSVKHTGALDHIRSKKHTSFKLGIYTRLFICSDKCTNNSVCAPGKY